MSVSAFSRAWVKLVVASFIAFPSLHFYAQQKISAENYALGDGTTSIREDWEGMPFTAYSAETIAAVVNKHRELLHARSSHARGYVLWLGNSQLHAVNQYGSGDHLAPYWLKTAASVPGAHGDLWPLGFSLPNANLQEHVVLGRYVASHVPLRALVLKLVFDDLREDGLRAGVSELLEDRAPSGTSAVSASEAPENTQESFTQTNIEARLDRALERIWTLWSERPALRAHLFTDLYQLRNSVFGIKSTTVRKMIKARYERNMMALEMLLADYRTRSIPVLIYVAPIRQDIAFPYDTNEYEGWKLAVREIAERHSAALINLEKLVPGQYWGQRSDGEIDFMHFQGQGHRLLADALAPYLTRVTLVKGG